MDQCVEQREELARLCQEELTVFIGCGKKKTWHKTRAEYLYQGTYYRSCLALARKLTDRKHIFILSAKYGVLPLDREVKPYNVKLTELPAVERRIWLKRVRRDIERLSRGRKRVFICSREYVQGIEGQRLLPQVGIGRQLQWMKQILSHL